LSETDTQTHILVAIKYIEIKYTTDSYIHAYSVLCRAR